VERLLLIGEYTEKNQGMARKSAKLAKKKEIRILL
jgi:hypothetical protein